MMTAKEALAKDGKVAVTMGRGRLSVEATARVRELAASGWDIKGYNVSTSQGSTTPTVTKDVSNGGKTIADLPPLRYDETLYKAVSDTPSSLGQTVFGMREVCGFCKSSLSYHRCDTPITHGVRVRIMEK